MGDNLGLQPMSEVGLRGSHVKLSPYSVESDAVS